MTQETLDKLTDGPATVITPQMTHRWYWENADSQRAQQAAWGFARLRELEMRIAFLKSEGDVFVPAKHRKVETMKDLVWHGDVISHSKSERNSLHLL